MYTRHNALRNARIESYQNMYFAQQIELRDQREEKRKEEERKKKAEEEELRLEQLKTGERFEISLNSSDTLVGLKLTDTSDTSEIYLELKNQDAIDNPYDYNCYHKYYLDKSKVRNLIDQLTKLHDMMTDPKPKVPEKICSDPNEKYPKEVCSDCGIIFINTCADEDYECDNCSRISCEDCANKYDEHLCEHVWLCKLCCDNKQNKD